MQCIEYKIELLAYSARARAHLPRFSFCSSRGQVSVLVLCYHIGPKTLMSATSTLPMDQNEWEEIVRIGAKLSKYADRMFRRLTGNGRCWKKVIDVKKKHILTQTHQGLLQLHQTKIEPRHV